MPDFQRIVDDLRNAVVYPSGEPTYEAIDPPLAEYGEACERANERLRHCEALLKKGLRSEAIQYAEIEPNLLDVVAMLDFPEREVAANALRSLNLALPLLHAEIAGDLNEAYALQQPLDSLLSRHRYLALAAAPLKDRLKVLRRIAEADPTNPIWNEDVAAYEQERMKELHAAAARAAKTRNLELLDSCFTELTQSAWQQMPPEAFKRSLSKARDELGRSLAYERLQKLEPELNAAYAALDVDLGRKHREAWNAAFLVAQPASGDPLLQRCAPALDWLDDRDRRDAEAASFAAACAELENALEADTVTAADRVRLESLYHAAERHGVELPAALESRYRARIAAWDLSATRRTRLRLIVAVAAILLVAGGVTFGIRAQLANREIKEAATALGALIAQGKEDPDRLPEAAAFYAKLVELRPEMANVPVIQQLQGEVANELRKEQERKERFQKALELAKSRGAENPDLDALNEASASVRVNEEKAALAVFQAEIAQIERARRTAREQAFTDEMKRLADLVAAVETLGFGDIEALKKSLDALRVEIDAAQARHTAVAQAVTLLAPLHKRIGALRDAADRIAGERRAAEDVVASVNSRAAYLAALKSYGDSQAGGRADDFKLALAESQHWRRIDEWNAAAAAANDVQHATATPEQIRSTKSAAQSFQRFPHVARFQAVVEHCERLAARRDVNGLSKIVGLRTMFDNQLLLKSWMLRTRTEKYYLLEKPVLTPTSQALTHVVDYSLKTKNIIVPSAEVVEVVPAPHCAMSASVLTELDRMKLGTEIDWELGFAKILRIIYESRQVEPLLRLGLLKRVLETACEGSAAMPTFMQVERKLFESSNANLLVNWMDAKSEDAKQAARTAETELSRLVDLPMNADRAAAAVKDRPQSVAPLPRYDLVGCLMNDPELGWTCTGRKLADKLSGQLVVMTPNAATGDLLRGVGTCQDGKVKLSAVNAGFVEGRLVWIEASP